MSKKGENIYKRKGGRWEGRYIRFYDGSGKAKYGYVYGKTYSTVKQQLIEKKSCSGTNAALCTDRPILYSYVLDAWLQSMSINIKESTYAHYFNLISTTIIFVVSLLKDLISLGFSGLINNEATRLTIY